MVRAAGGRQILLLHSDGTFQDRVRSGAPDGFGCWTLPDWTALRETARHAAPSTVAIVDPLAGSPDGGPSPELRGFLTDFAWIPVVAAVPPGRGTAELHLTLRRWGVSELLVREVEDTPAGIASAIRFAQGKELQGVLEGILPAAMPGRVRRLLFAAARAVSAGGHSPDLAAVLGVNETTVIRRCEQLRLPTPRRIMAWMRILLAARLLDEESRTAQSVAYACGYATEAGLRRVVQNCVGLGITELRRQGALRTAAKVFLAELRAGRAAGTEREA
jgi:AraC-like DNA-binding protein